MQFEDVANEVGCEYLHYYFYVTCHVLRCHWRSTLANLYSTLKTRVLFVYVIFMMACIRLYSSCVRFFV